MNLTSLRSIPSSVTFEPRRNGSPSSEKYEDGSTTTPTPIRGASLFNGKTCQEVGRSPSIGCCTRRPLLCAPRKVRDLCTFLRSSKTERKRCMAETILSIRAVSASRKSAMRRCSSTGGDGISSSPMSAALRFCSPVVVELNFLICCLAYVLFMKYHANRELWVGATRSLCRKFEKEAPVDPSPTYPVLPRWASLPLDRTTRRSPLARRVREISRSVNERFAGSSGRRFPSRSISVDRSTGTPKPSSGSSPQAPESVAARQYLSFTNSSPHPTASESQPPATSTPRRSPPTASAACTRKSAA